MFILGCDPKLTKEVDYADAANEESAEEDVLWHRDGYGVISTTQMDLDYPDFTKPQVDGIEDRVHKVLSAVIPDAADRDNAVDAILSDVINDIEETADWSDLDDDECNLNDIDIAIARVVKEKLCKE
jgi:hypothetical protein